ncbi:transketolase [Erythrobacteraceae bacterium CFH 75059]|uniref:transketolase n=1 Tax=Qipengyuania thermophila TaxID=2509361 RepID=UPI00101EBBBB|nr:transketolase [Qipengyuania thermophila]TCD05076.1 transketolase [Erythrobacteraceae bacterium CFH 75059]
MAASSERLQHMANAVRILAIDAVEEANSGHPGMPMGMADAATVLWTRHLKHDPADPAWPDRDRFVLSAGHGSMLLYALLHLTGYAQPTRDDLRRFRRLDSVCAGHPENFLIPGVECTTGPLGQGVAMAVGMAMAERHLNALHGDDLVDHRTWVIAGDGCLMEGINHEAVGLAGQLGLGRLNVLFDSNRITIDGSTELSTCEDIAARHRAAGWHVLECDGHDVDAVDAALTEAAQEQVRPSLVICHTIIGKGAPNLQGTEALHGAPLGIDEARATREALGWPHEPFVIPNDILADWRDAGRRAASEHARWRDRAGDRINELRSATEGLQNRAAAAVQPLIRELATAPQTVATRKASQMALDRLSPAIPQLVGGSADLTGSNNTKAAGMTPFTRNDRAGRYVYYGIREFGMAAAMNGMALHGGLVPYGGTFLVFSDYCRNAVRLSALSQAQVVYVFTHDSIGLGEDGPTHQPVEHLMSLRLIPNLNVFRPADAIETAECWALALATPGTPSVLALSRQNLPPVRGDADAEWTPESNRCARGAYRLREARSPRRVILIATGSEVHLALAAADLLESRGVGADVVSMPCMELFAQQPRDYQEDILPDAQPDEILRVSIEAGATLGWDRFTMTRGLRIGIDRFGASAPAKDVFAKFGFTADSIADRIHDKLTN